MMFRIFSFFARGEGFASDLWPQTAEGDMPPTYSEALLRPQTTEGDRVREAN